MFQNRKFLEWLFYLALISGEQVMKRENKLDDQPCEKLSHPEIRVLPDESLTRDPTILWTLLCFWQAFEFAFFMPSFSSYNFTKHAVILRKIYIHIYIYGRYMLLFIL